MGRVFWAGTEWEDVKEIINTYVVGDRRVPVLGELNDKAISTIEAVGEAGNEIKLVGDPGLDGFPVYWVTINAGMAVLERLVRLLNASFDTGTAHNYGLVHWKNFLGRIDFCVESYPVFESSRIKYLQDPRPESFWYYSTIHGTRWKYSRWKTEYINELYYIIFDKDGKNIFNSFFTEIFVL